MTKNEIKLYLDDLNSRLKNIIGMVYMNGDLTIYAALANLLKRYQFLYEKI